MRHGRWVYFLALVLTIVSFLPLAIPVFFTVVELISSGRLLYDFLMPAELFLLTVIGGGGIVVLGVAGKISIKRLVVYLALDVASVGGAQVWAVLSGLAHGDTELTGVHVFAITIFAILFHLFALLVGLECVRICRSLRGAPKPS